jgi:hypothetical protein
MPELKRESWGPDFHLSLDLTVLSHLANAECLLFGAQFHGYMKRKNICMRFFEGSIFLLF